MSTHSHDDHQHDHEQSGHHHEHGPSGVWGWLLSLFHLGGHEHHHGAESLVADDAFASSQEGIRTIWIALGLMGATTLFQVIIYLFAGSVALLADTVHNLGDALNTLPLLLAFRLSGRPPNRRYTYGYHRAEDVAGVIIVLSIAFSAGYVFWESFQKFIDPEPIRNLGAVAAAALIGFLGNEAVATLQIRTGRKIGSAALVTDGLHARTDGLTSLAVLIAAGGAWLGFPLVDPIIGLLIGLAIVLITRDAIVSVWYRLMDAIEPELYDQAEQALQRQIKEFEDIKEIRRLRLRWLGHRLNADLVLAVDPQLTTAQSHHLAEQVRHRLFDEMPLLTEAITHVEPWDHGVEQFHRLTAKREPVPKPFAEE
ncbi:MAG TPA: cation diffusion facilitator family transporter [Anaerolineae bacterium]|nr:cation diffusion facilitator family transporter [Anaerolineae bacterium]